MKDGNMEEMVEGYLKNQEKQRGKESTNNVFGYTVLLISLLVLLVTVVAGAVIAEIRTREQKENLEGSVVRVEYVATSGWDSILNVEDVKEYITEGNYKYIKETGGYASTSEILMREGYYYQEEDNNIIIGGDELYDYQSMVIYNHISYFISSITVAFILIGAFMILDRLVSHEKRLKMQ